MQTVIGLDIGSYSIKAVEIINKFKTFEVVNFYETVIPSLEDVPLDAVVPVCMEQLFEENNIKADRIITAMPGQFISSRILPFLFSDPRKIETSVAIELEDHVPFNLEDMVVDHQVLGTANGTTMVLAVMTRKAFLRNFLDLLSRISIDPKLVDVDSLAYYNLSSHLALDNDGSFGIVDLGHEKTSICIIRDGMLRMFRTINLGGRYITDFLARDLETTYHDAQRIKHSISRVLTRQSAGEELDQRDREIAERITLATNAIVKELGRTLYSFKSWEKEPVSNIYITGGTSCIGKLDELLAEQLEVAVAPLRLEGDSRVVIPEGRLYSQYSVPQSLAIGLRAVTNVKKHSQINLRRGEFSYVQNYHALLKGASIALKVVTIVLFMLVSSYAVRHYFYEDQISQLRKAYTEVYKRHFPKAKTGNKTFNAIKSEANNRLSQGIISVNQAIDEFKHLNSSSPALELLKEISAKIPKDVHIDVTLYDFRTIGAGQGKLIFKAETDGFDSQSKIIDAMKLIEGLENVEEKDAVPKPGSDNKIIEITINAEYNKTESI